VERKSGIIRSWHQKRGFGIVRVGPESSLEKYFLHVSNIRTGTATPEIGWAVEFEVGTKPVPEGQLPQAIRADILIPKEHQEQSTAPSIDTTVEKDGEEGAL
jgi:cold shock CspA family protein